MNVSIRRERNHFPGSVRYGTVIEIIVGRGRELERDVADSRSESGRTRGAIALHMRFLLTLRRINRTTIERGERGLLS